MLFCLIWNSDLMGSFIFVMPVYLFIVLRDIKNRQTGISLAVKRLRPRLPMQGVWVWSLVRVLRSHMPRDQKHQNMKQKQHYNKFNKDFKNVLSFSVTFDSLHPLDCSPPGSSVHGILQARILDWISISSPRGSSQPWDWARVSCLAGRIFHRWATGDLNGPR